MIISTTCPPVVCVKAWRLSDDARSVCQFMSSAHSQPFPNSSGNTGGRACPCQSNTSLRNVKYHCKGVRQSGNSHQNSHITPTTQLPMLKASAWPGNIKWGRHRDTLVKMETTGSHLSNSLKLLNTRQFLDFTSFSPISNNVELTNNSIRSN